MEEEPVFDLMMEGTDVEDIEEERWDEPQLLDGDLSVSQIGTSTSSGMPLPGAFLFSFSQQPLLALRFMFPKPMANKSKHSSKPNTQPVMFVAFGAIIFFGRGPIFTKRHQ